jgi:hypothetical protein
MSSRNLPHHLYIYVDSAGARRDYEGDEEMIDDKSDAGSWADAIKFKAAVEPDVT